MHAQSANREKGCSAPQDNCRLAVYKQNRRCVLIGSANGGFEVCSAAQSQSASRSVSLQAWVWLTDGGGLVGREVDSRDGEVEKDY